MNAGKGENVAACARCGKELNEFTSRPASEEWFDEGFAPYCTDCQQTYFDALAAKTSPSLALFYCCIAFNAPLDLKAAPVGIAEEKDVWKQYIDTLRTSRRGVSEDGAPLTFFQGLTDISKIFGDDLQKGQFSRMVDLERSAKERKPGTAKQREKWGKGPKEKPYTSEDYDELDRIEKAFSGDLLSNGGLSSKQEYILRDCAQMEYAKQQYIKVGNINMAQKLNNMIQTNLASENLRKKDEKPLDDLRIDSIVDALERKGYMKNGKLLNEQQLLEKLRGDNPRYPYTKDAADQMLLKIINASRANDGLPEYLTLPAEYEIEDVNGEFAETPSPQEKEAYERLGLLRAPQRKKEKSE